MSDFTYFPLHIYEDNSGVLHAVFDCYPTKSQVINLEYDPEDLTWDHRIDGDPDSEYREATQNIILKYSPDGEITWSENTHKWGTAAQEYCVKWCQDREVLADLADFLEYSDPLFDSLDQSGQYEFRFYRAGSLWSADLEDSDQPVFQFTGWKQSKEDLFNALQSWIWSQAA
jgi:hypothetical protein